VLFLFSIARGCSHQGELTTYCNREPVHLTHANNGAFMCDHEVRVIRENHWSCCGATEFGSRECVKRVPPPPKRSPHHRGEWRDQKCGVLTTYCAREPMHLTAHPNNGTVLCEHTVPKVLQKNHWSCCASIDINSTECVELQASGVTAKTNKYWFFLKKILVKSTHALPPAFLPHFYLFALTFHYII
jgi:hypothetical protein